MIGLTVAAALSVWAPSKIAERQVTAALRPHLEPTGSVQVRAWTTAPAFVRGRIDRLRVEARAIRLGDLTADHLAASLAGITLTRSPANGRIIGQARSGDVAIEIGRAGLERFLRARGVQNPSVTIDATGVMATGQARVGAIEVTARVRGQFYAASGRDLLFRVTSLEVSGVELPPPLAATVLALIQPAVSLDALPFPIVIERVTSSDGRIVVQARVEGSGP